MQVSDKERELEYQTLFRDVASILAEKCVNSQSNRPFTISMLERSMKDLHVSVDPKRSAKQQALEVRPTVHASGHSAHGLMAAASLCVCFCDLTSGRTQSCRVLHSLSRA